jgi:CheY-like chemotaxis protein
VEGKGMQIALLEDIPAITEMIIDALHMHGDAIASWSSGPALLAALCIPADGQHDCMLSFNLLIADYLLPGGMTGGEVIATLRQWYPAEILPIILLSRANPADLSEVQAQFPDIVAMQKPFAIKALLVTIQQVSMKDRDGMPTYS